MEQLKNPLTVVLLIAIAGTGVVAWRLGNQPTPPDVEARTALVRTRRAELDQLRACMATGQRWTLNTTETAGDAGAAPDAARQATCRAQATALGLVGAIADADGTVVLVMYASTAGRLTGVAWLPNPGDRIAREPDGWFANVDDAWYLYSSGR